MMDIYIDALAEEVTSAANIVTNDGYYEIDMDAVAKCLDKALATTRAELSTLKAREVGYVRAMDAMGEELAAKDAALREALALMRGEPDMSLPGSDHWLWAKKVRELIGEGETA